MLLEVIEGKTIAKKMVISQYLLNELWYQKFVFPPYWYYVQNTVSWNGNETQLLILSQIKDLGMWTFFLS